MSTLDQIKEVPRGDTPPHRSAAAIPNNAVADDIAGFNQRSSPQISPGLPCFRSNRGRHGSSASRISVDYFDPDGVQELRRTLTRMNTEGPEAVEEAQEQPAITSSVDSKRSEASESTLAPQEGPFDFAKTLRDIVEKRADANIKSRELGVLFEDLRVVGLGASASFQPTFGSTLNPLSIIGAIKTMRHPPLRNILTGFEGVVRPGEMLLVLGRPGSGCSTLLKILANQRAEYHAVEGHVDYDSFSPRAIEKHHRGDVQYSPEDDVHFPTLTVEQTIQFAATTRTPEVRLGDNTRKSFRVRMTDVLTTIFGLRHVKKTPVGDASIRGVSGGEKKRVSISEALATRSLITSWDNSTRGLDASTAVEFVRALRIATDTFRLTTIVSIYQAGESLYEMFDKVCLIHDGRMAYFGRADQARQYFMDMDYEPADRQTTADFLVAVTDPKGRTPRAGAVPPPPRNAAEFEAYYQKSDIKQQNMEDMAAYRREFVGQPTRVSAYRQSAWAEYAHHARITSSYTISIPMQVRAVMKRRVLILKGSWGTQAIQALTFVFQAIILGTTFLKLPESTSAYYSRGGILFFAIFLPALFAMSEIPALFSQRPIVERHKKAAMYHPFVEGLAMTLVDVPVTFATMVLYTIILYFLVKLQQTAGQFFIFFLIVFTIAITMKAFFRGLAAAFKAEAPAQAVAGILVLAMALYTGYTIPLISMIGALKWISYLNPLRWAFEAVMTNEFHTINGQCATLVPQGSDYNNFPVANKVCTVLGSMPGQTLVNGERFVELSFAYNQSHLWRNFGFCLAYGILFASVLLILTEFNTGTAGQTSVTTFKRGSSTSVVQNSGPPTEEVDEKALQANRGAVNYEKSQSDGERESARALAQEQKMTDIFSWQNVNYVVPVSGGQHRQLLDDVSGYVSPGKLTALMGESGAGKTTLLNVLAERSGTGIITGYRFVNGQALPPDFQAQTGYCQQTDTHLPTMSVRESVYFSATMRQPASVPRAEKEAYTEQCLRMCGLEDFADAVVGSLGVELRKRTTIAVELAAKPKLLLFLDEPTSGLDSQSAWSIMSFLRNLADNGQAILCTIHQPSAELFQVFDRLLLLRKGGQTVYMGDIGSNATGLIHYFEMNGSRACKPDENPAEFMLDVIGAGATALSDTDWHHVWLGSKEHEILFEDIEDIHSTGRSRPQVVATIHTEFATSWRHQVQVLFRREMIDKWRNPTYLMAKLTLNIIAGLFIGFTFFHSKNTLQGTQNKLFSIYMATILSVPLSNQLQVPYIKMRSIYEIREQPSRMYAWSALVTSQLMVEIPLNVINSSIFFLCWYWTVGFDSNRGAYTYLFLSFLMPLYYTTIATAVAAMSPNPQIAGILFSFLFSFVLTFNGVLQPYSQLNWWRWMYHLSPYTYLIEGLLGQAVGNQEIACATKEFVSLEPPSGLSCGSYLQSFITQNGGYLINADATSGCQYCVFRTTNEWLLTRFNIRYSHRWRDVGIFCVFILFNTAAVYGLTYLRMHFSGILESIYNFVTSRKATRKTKHASAV